MAAAVDVAVAVAAVAVTAAAAAVETVAAIAGKESRRDIARAFSLTKKGPQYGGPFFYAVDAWQAYLRFSASFFTQAVAVTKPSFDK